MNALDFIQRIDVTTAYGPPYSYDPQAPSEKSWFLDLMKPKITVWPIGGGSPFVAAPYGDPGDGNWGYVKTGLVIGGGLLLLLLLLGGGDAIRRLKR